MADYTAILRALYSEDARLRASAEQQVKELAASNFGEYLSALSNIYVNQSDQQQAQLASILIKNALSLQSTTVHPWLSIPAATRDDIRKKLFGSLATNRLSSQVVANLLVIELPENPERINILIENILPQQGDKNLKTNSLKALEAIGEDVDPEEINEATPAILNGILSNIYGGDGDDIKIAAANALRPFLDFEAYFDKDVTERTCAAILSAVKSSSERLVEAGYQCLASIPTLHYHNLPVYMEKLAGPMMEATKGAPQPVLQAILEFWNAVAETEIRNQEDMESFHIVEKNLRTLVPLILKNLPKEEDADEEEYTVSSASAVCLQLIAECVGVAVIKFVQPFVEQNISDNDWRMKEAAISAFGVSLKIDEGMESFVTKIKPQIFKLATTAPEDQVRESAIWAISRICEFHRDVVSNDIDTIVQLLLTALQDSEVVARGVPTGLASIAKSFSGDIETPNDKFFKPYFATVLKEILKFALSTPSPERAYEGINTIIESTQNVQNAKIHQEIQTFLYGIHGVISRGGSEGLCVVLHSCTLCLGPEILPHADKLARMYLQLLSDKDNSGSEALIAFSSLASAIGEGEMEKYMPELFPIILTKMKSKDELAAQEAIGMISSIGKGIRPYAKDFVAILLELCTSASVSRSLKPAILAGFADVAIAIEEEFAIYATPVLLVLGQAARYPREDDSLETVDFINELRLSVVDAYVGIILALNTANQIEKIDGHLTDISYTVLQVCKDETSAPNVISATLGLIVDLATASRAKDLLQNEVVKQIVAESATGDDIALGEAAQLVQAEMRKAARKK